MGAIERTTYKDHVIDYICEEVRENRLKPGEKVTESRLATELGISRAPIREALAELVSGGILEYRPQIGNFVARLSPREIIDAYEVRGVLEGYSVSRGVGTFNEKLFTRLEAMICEMELYATENKRRELIRVGSDFHRLLCSGCDNNQVDHLTQQLSMKLNLLFYKFWADVYVASEIVERHRLIVDSLKNGNADEIEVVMRNHYTQTGEKVAKLVAGQRKGKKPLEKNNRL